MEKIDNKEIVLRIDGKCPSKKNQYRQARGHWYKPKEVVDYIEDALWQINGQRSSFQVVKTPITKDCEVDIICYISGRDKDGDNLQTTIWDILVKAEIIKDDNLIVNWGGIKIRKSKSDYVDILIREL